MEQAGDARARAARALRNASLMCAALVCRRPTARLAPTRAARTLKTLPAPCAPRGRAGAHQMSKTRSVRIRGGEVVYFEWVPPHERRSALRVVTERAAVLVCTRDHRNGRSLTMRWQHADHHWVTYEERLGSFRLCVFNEAEKDVEVLFEGPLSLTTEDADLPEHGADVARDGDAVLADEHIDDAGVGGEDAGDGGEDAGDSGEECMQQEQTTSFK